MAGDWMKVELTTPHKPELMRVAASVTIQANSLDAVFARWFRLWAWANENVGADGIAHNMTLELLSAIVQTPGLAEAFAEVGWLKTRAKGVEFVNWDRHNSKSAKARAQANRRVAKYRKKKQGKGECNADSVTDVTVERYKCNGEALQKALPEKRREEKRTEENHPSAISCEDKSSSPSHGADGRKIHPSGGWSMGGASVPATPMEALELCGVRRPVARDLTERAPGLTVGQIGADWEEICAASDRVVNPQGVLVYRICTRFNLDAPKIGKLSASDISWMKDIHRMQENYRNGTEYA